MEAKEIQSVKNQCININLKNGEDNQLITPDDDDDYPSPIKVPIIYFFYARYLPRVKTYFKQRFFI